MGGVGRKEKGKGNKKRRIEDGEKGEEDEGRRLRGIGKREGGNMESLLKCDRNEK